MTSRSFNIIKLVIEFVADIGIHLCFRLVKDFEVLQLYRLRDSYVCSFIDSSPYTPNREEPEKVCTKSKVLVQDVVLDPDLAQIPGEDFDLDFRALKGKYLGFANSFLDLPDVTFESSELLSEAELRNLFAKDAKSIVERATVYFLNILRVNGIAVDSKQKHPVRYVLAKYNPGVMKAYLKRLPTNGIRVQGFGSIEDYNVKKVIGESLQASVTPGDDLFAGFKNPRYFQHSLFRTSMKQVSIFISTVELGEIEIPLGVALKEEYWGYVADKQPSKIYGVAQRVYVDANVSEYNYVRYLSKNPKEMEEKLKKAFGSDKYDYSSWYAYFVGPEYNLVSDKSVTGELPEMFNEILDNPVKHVDLYPDTVEAYKSKVMQSIQDFIGLEDQEIPLDVKTK